MLWMRVMTERGFGARRGGDRVVRRIDPLWCFAKPTACSLWIASGAARNDSAPRKCAVEVRGVGSVRMGVGHALVACELHCMNWVDWLTAIGALLGTFAFFQNAFRGIAATNKAKWAALVPDMITEDEFARALQQIRMPGHVNEQDLRSLLRMNNKLHEKGDSFRFKSLWGDQYKKHIDVLIHVTDSMRTRLTHPIWNKHPFPDGVGAIYALNEDHFRQQHGAQGAPTEMEKVRKALEADMQRASTALSALRVLANREDIEYLLPWKWRA